MIFRDNPADIVEAREELALRLKAMEAKEKPEPRETIPRECVWCTASFQATMATTRYCSSRCRTLAYRERKTGKAPTRTPYVQPRERRRRKCDQCGESFWWEQSKKKRCSAECNNAAQVALRRERRRRQQTESQPPPVRNCPHCGGVIPQHRAARMFCSVDCGYAAWQILETELEQERLSDGTQQAG